MKRTIEETWENVGFDVSTRNMPVADQNGNILHEANGIPKTQPITLLHLIIPEPDGQRAIHIVFSPEGKAKLIEKLTGGIVIANGANT